MLLDKHKNVPNKEIGRQTNNGRPQESYRKMSGSEIFRPAAAGGPRNQSPLEGRDTVEGGF